MITTVYLIALALVLYVIIKLAGKKQAPLPQPTEDVEKKILNEHVDFYKKLNTTEQSEFLQRVQTFLAKVRITGVNTTVEDTDRVLIASAAIIPIFYFKKWEYINIHEVLLYPNSFSENFDQEGTERNILGEVGSGALNNVMIISKADLHNGFYDSNSTSNTAIHEFVHLIDKTDGDTDGLPDVLLKHREKSL